MVENKLYILTGHKGDKVVNEIAVIENSKEFLKKILYNIRYGRKFKKFNIDKSFSDTLINGSKDSNEKEIFHLIRKSRNQEDFSNNIKDYLKAKERSVYASTLLIGNVTGKYVFNDFYYASIKGLNIDAFSKENQELIQELKSHFTEYIVNNNKRKNVFAERIKVGNSIFKDLSKDINEEKLDDDFEKVLNGDATNDNYSKTKVIAEYLMKIIGIYSKDDIKNNFDFILYDINNSYTNGLDDRRKKYLLHKSLSNNQLRKIDEISILKQRLQGISGKESEQLLVRLDAIEKDLDENISELEDIYRDYEVLYRQDLIDNLYVPREDITIIEDYKDLRPQLIHRFIRNPEKFREIEISKIKEKIISERTNGNNIEELTVDEQKRLNKLINQVNVNLDQYKVNYTTDGIGTSYTDSLGFDIYHSDTSNQISASVFEGKEFINSSSVGIIGIGFNKETLTPEAIAVSSNSYKTTNKGINNLEYDEEDEFEEMSAPFLELLNAKGQSEIVMHRRMMDFETKASYIFAKIDSSNSKQTNEIMKQIEQIKEKEGLKVVIYDVYKIRESLEQTKQEKNKNEVKEL